MQVKFLGAARVVTGSCFLLETNECNILVDCGLFQGPDQLKERNYGEFPFAPEEIDFLLLTHAHIDHSGLIPKLCKKGFRGQIITTNATRDLCEIMLADSGYIQEMEVERKNRKLIRAGQPPLEPIYTYEDAIDSLSFFKSYHYGDIIKLTPDITVRFKDAGHILGSAITEIWVKEDGHEVKLIFTGDLGNQNQPIIRNPDLVAEADYLFIESTYGDRLHEDRQSDVSKLREIISDTVKSGGNVIIPSFAVGRTQDIIYELNGLVGKGLIPLVPVYVDSPLAISATKIFRKNPECYDSETLHLLASGDLPLDFPTLKFTKTVEESKYLNENAKGSIIISASGMCDAGRIKHHLKHNLWRPESSILFVGYQAEGTLGRRILDGEKLVRIHGEEISVNARIHSIQSLSAHADQDGLLNWVSKMISPPRKIFVVHGEEKASLNLSRLFKERLGIDSYVPYMGDTFKLEPEGKSKLLVSSSTRDLTIEEKEFAYNFVHQAYLLFKNSLNNLPIMENTPEEIDKLKEELQELIVNLEKMSSGNIKSA